MTKSFAGGVRVGGIVKLESIKYACSLAPVLTEDFDSPSSDLGTVDENNVMDKIHTYYINPFNSHVEYELFRSQ